MQVLVYLGIFLAKLVEVSLATIRVVFINRGEKLRGAIIGFIEIMLWIVVVSNVLSDLSRDPMKAVVYCFAFALGNYLGVIIENKLAVGTASIQTVVMEEHTHELSALLREHGFGVTILQGQGMENTVDVLLIFLKRKSVPEAVGLIRSFLPNAVISINDVRQLRNGFVRK